MWRQTVRDATESVIDRQAEVGLDIVNNGEQPRVSFNWYVANRLSGIGGPREAPLWDDLAEYPEDAFGTEAIDTFTEFLAASDADFEDTFLTAASPGIAAATLVNDHYDSHEEFLHAVGEALKPEYERVADAVAGPTRIVAAPDCGFDTQAGLAMIHPEIAWAKLETLVDGAAVATDRLFG